MADREPFAVPEGWQLVNKVNSNGTTVKYYTNVLGQKFYNEEDLLRNIKDAKERGLSIYDPEFNASSFGASSSVHKKKSKVGKASTRICKKEKQSTSIREAKSSKKQKEVEKQHEIQATGSTKCRTSRRIAGLEPELTSDFLCNKALEYVIKEKTR